MILFYANLPFNTAQNYTEFMYNIQKYINREDLKLDRNTRSTLLQSIFKNKYQYVLVQKQLIEHIRKTRSSLLNNNEFHQTQLSQRIEENYSTKITNIALQLLQEAESDIEKSIKIVTHYVNDNNIQKVSFWKWINEVHQIAQEKQIKTECALQRTTLIDRMKKGKHSDLDQFSSDKFEKYDPKHHKKTYFSAEI